MLARARALLLQPPPCLVVHVGVALNNCELPWGIRRRLLQKRLLPSRDFPRLQQRTRMRRGALCLRAHTKHWASKPCLVCNVAHHTMAGTEGCPSASAKVSNRWCHNLSVAHHRHPHSHPLLLEQLCPLLKVFDCEVAHARVGKLQHTLLYRAPPHVHHADDFTLGPLEACAIECLFVKLVCRRAPPHP